jgi:hypothetical protein
VDQSIRSEIGDYGTRFVRVTRAATAYRRQLEDRVRVRLGAINTTHDAEIHRAVVARIAAGIRRQLLREDSERMTPADIDRCLERIERASQQRLDAVEALGIDAPAELTPEEMMRQQIEENQRMAAAASRAAKAIEHAPADASGDVATDSEGERPADDYTSPFRGGAQ